MGGVTLQQASMPYRGKQKYSWSLHATETGISSTCMVLMHTVFQHTCLVQSRGLGGQEMGEGGGGYGTLKMKRQEGDENRDKLGRSYVSLCNTLLQKKYTEMRVSKNAEDTDSSMNGKWEAQSPFSHPLSPHPHIVGGISRRTAVVNLVDHLFLFKGSCQRFDSEDVWVKDTKQFNFKIYIYYRRHFQYDV